MKVNWTALGIVATSAIAGVSGVATIVGAAQSVQQDVTLMKVMYAEQSKQIEKVTTRVDFIYEAFFNGDKT